MRHVLRVVTVIFVMIGLFLAGCTPGDAGDTTVSPGTTALPGDTTADITSASDITSSEAAESQPLATGKYSILFIGNSYTYYNDMPETFKALAESAGYEITLLEVTKGGYTLAQMADENDTVGKQADTVLKARKFDFVFIQEQSVRPASAPAFFYDGCRAVAAKVRANGAVPVLYQTWGSKAGHSSLSDNGWTTDTMHSRLRAAYEAMGEELDAPVSHVGVAFLDVYENHPSINLYDADLKHPSPAGSYLAACVHYATVFSRTPIGLPNTPKFPDETLTVLQQAAYDAVFNTPELAAEYKTSSVGVTVPEGGFYGIDVTKTVNLSAYPTGSTIISVVDGAGVAGKTFTGILGDNGKNCSAATGTSLTAGQLADLADIKYGVSLIGAVSMPQTTKSGATFTGLGALVNGHWGSSWMANFTFGTKKYDIAGAEKTDGKYFGLITLNFGSVCKFDAIGFFSGSLQGFPQVAEVYVSDDGITWTCVPSACYDAAYLAAEGKTLTSIGASPADPWQANSSKVAVLFSMEGVSGKYIRMAVAIGKGDPAALTTESVQDINTRELVVYGSRP